MTAGSFRCEPLPRDRNEAVELLRRSPGWRGLAEQAESFFQSPLWIETWLGLLPDDCRAWLCRLGEPGAPRALALLGRRRLRSGRLPLPLQRASLMESGDPAYDRLAVEFTAPLLAGPDALAPFLAGLIEETRPDYELLVARCRPQLAEALAEAAGRAGRPFAVYRRSLGWLCELPEARNGDYLDRLSRNTRQAVRRTRRLLEAEGPLALEAARSQEEAQDFLDALRRLHTRTWQARGEAGAFASPRLVAFHRRLVEHGFPGQVQLLRLRVGARALGYLYNFLHRGRVHQYQVGFDYPADKRLNLGLLAHVLAIEHYRRSGARHYDLLAGDAQYKRQLATRSYELLSCGVAGASPLARLARLGRAPRRQRN